MESPSQFSLKSSVDTFNWTENSIDDVLVNAVSDDSQSFTSRMDLEEDTACNEQLNTLFNETICSGNDLFDFLNSSFTDNADLTCTTLQRLGSPASPSSCHRSESWDDHHSTAELDSSNDYLEEGSDTQSVKPTKVRGRKNGAGNSKSMTKNAIAARRNREKNKAYVVSLEHQVKVKQQERDELLSKSKAIKDTNGKLETELTFLKSMVSYMDDFRRKMSPSQSNANASHTSSSTASLQQPDVCGVCPCCQSMSKAGKISL